MNLSNFSDNEHKRAAKYFNTPGITIVLVDVLVVVVVTAAVVVVRLKSAISNHLIF
jgi:hypothetical protein